MSLDFSLDDADEDNVSLLMSMGFSNADEVQRALEFANGDVNQALSYLTNETPGLYDVDMHDSAASADSSSDQGTFVFPVKLLEDLESRVFVPDWSGKDEALAKCLKAAIDIAKKGLSDSMFNCKRFETQFLPFYFNKLLRSSAANTRVPIIHEGIFNVLKLLVDLVVARLSEEVDESLPRELLNILGVVFDPLTEFHLTNKNQNWLRSISESAFDDGECRLSCGYLPELIDCFAMQGGFASVARLFESTQLNCLDMLLLLFPFAQCVDYLKIAVVAPLLLPCVNRAKQYISELSETQLKKPSTTNNAMNTLCSAMILSLSLSPSCDRDEFDRLRLDVTLKFLKSSHFGARMQALHEISKVLEWRHNPKYAKIAIKADVVSPWLAANEVLLLALEGNIGQVEYFTRLSGCGLLECVCPQLASTDIAKIWQLQENRSNNLNIIIAKIATMLREEQLDYLISLVEQDWASENCRDREWLLQLVGRIGRDTAPTAAFTKSHLLLWSWLHETNVHLMDAGVREFLRILSVPGRKSVRKDYVLRSFEDIKTTDKPAAAVALCECMIQRMAELSQSTQENPTKIQRKTASVPANEPLVIPVRWRIPDFLNLLKTSEPGSTLVCPEQFSHDSWPGLAWELILYPNGSGDYATDIALFMRLVATSSRKSQATALSAGFSLQFQPITPAATADMEDLTSEHDSSMQMFRVGAEHGVTEFASPMIVLNESLAKDGSVVVAGNILVPPAGSNRDVKCRQLYESGLDSNFTVKVDEESFAVHELILTQMSPTMATMFKTQCREVREKEVTIGDTTVDAVRAMLQSWYGDPLCFDELEDLSKDVYNLAARYQDFELRGICEAALLKMARRENAIHLAAFAINDSVESLASAACNLIVDHHEVLNDEDWDQLKEENFKLALAIMERVITICLDRMADYGYPKEHVKASNALSPVYVRSAGLSKSRKVKRLQRKLNRESKRRK